MLALALCSTNMPLQTIFAEEFTSGNPDVVSEEETPEIFTNEEQEAVGETDEELSVFSSEEVPEFNDAPDEAMAAAENEQAGEIDLADNDKVMNGVYTISSAGDYKFTCSRETGNRIVVDGKKISAKDSINIYLNKVNINTSAGPALRINLNVEATVTIHLTGTNSLITKNNYYAGLQKDNKARLIIKTNNSDATAGILNARSIDGDSAGIGGGFYGSVSCSNIIIDSCSVIASSKYGAGIGALHSPSLQSLLCECTLPVRRYPAARRRFQSAARFHCADLLKIADILLGKMIFNRMQHKPGEGDKSQYRGQADKKGQPQSE